MIQPGAVLLGIACAAAGWAIARRDGHPVWGAFAGGLLGPLGVLAVALVTWWSLARKRGKS